jgi:signal peptidase II
MRRADRSRAAGIAALAAALAALDQASKLLVVRELHPGRAVPVIAGFFNLTRVHNQGTAFGLFNRHGFIFILLSMVTIAAMIFFYRRLLSQGALVRWSAGLILGGALGNLIDRIFRGAVVDFLDVFLTLGGEEYHWPAFNLADSAICVGVGLLLITVVFQKKVT